MGNEENHMLGLKDACGKDFFTKGEKTKKLKSLLDE
jgi:hypothetical protein